MRWIAIAAVLLFTPTVAGQVGIYDVNLEISDLEVIDVEGALDYVDVYVTMTCQMATPDPTITYVVELQTQAGANDIYIGGPSSQTVSQACFSAVPISSMQHQLVWNLTIDANDFVEYGNGTVPFQVAVQAESNGGNPLTRGNSNEARADFTIRYQQSPATVNETQKPDSIPQEETTPAPAVGLVAVGILALARRRF